MVYLAQVWSVRQLDSLSSKHVHLKYAFGLTRSWYKKYEFLKELQELIQFVWNSQFLLHKQ